MNKIILLAGLFVVMSFAPAQAKQAELSTEVADTVFIEDMTWLEVRDAIANGKTTIIIATGGIEQNGPYLVTGKHNVILKLTTDKIARQLGNTLVAPIVAFVPEGDKNPPTKHMRYPGTISLTEATFSLLLREIAESFKVHGFTDIVFIGDSGPNQKVMATLTQQLNKEWQRSNTKAHYIAQYYDNPRWGKWLQAKGINEVKGKAHHDVRHTALMMLADPASVRVQSNTDAGKFMINEVNLLPVEKTLKLAEELLQYQTDITVDAIEQVRGKHLPASNKVNR